jgi:hypothetical protein
LPRPASTRAGRSVQARVDDYVCALRMGWLSLREFERAGDAARPMETDANTPLECVIHCPARMWPAKSASDSLESAALFNVAQLMSPRADFHRSPCWSHVARRIVRPRYGWSRVWRSSSARQSGRSCRWVSFFGRLDNASVTRMCALRHTGVLRLGGVSSLGSFAQPDFCKCHYWSGLRLIIGTPGSSCR